MDRHETDLQGDGGTKRTAVTRATLAAQVEEAVRSDIINGTLEPGQRLRASDLTQRYGVSATPLREALQRLAAHNLVELGPRLGTTVAPISEPELRDIYWLRELLETIALERSIRLGDQAWEQQITEAYLALERAVADTATPRRLEAWSVAHRSFHDALMRVCGSPWLLRFVSVLSDHSERYRTLSRRRGTRDPIQEHRSIYVAAVRRDAEGAQAALRSHLTGTVELLASAHHASGDETG